ncbi:hypothetical protein [Peribacillus simplex]|uniref:hypothetical protein n=1 Tax=Peribacillus simplex TaxID=1478 RepID=UPI00366CC783
MKKKLFLFLTACTLFLIMFMPNSTFAADNNPIDKRKVSLGIGGNVAETYLWVDWRHEVNLSASVSDYSKHSMIVTFTGPSGKVIKSTVVGRGNFVSKTYWWPKTGYYYLTLDCYGTNRDCEAVGSITETD